MLSQDFKEFVKLLNRHEVEYLIVGGYAVGMHGHPRYTGDLDIWINATIENAQKMVKVIDKFGFSSFGLTEMDFMGLNNVIQMGYPPFRIDLLTTVDGVSFDDCYQKKITIQYNNIELKVISFDDLRKNKKASGRPKDLEDLRNLKPISNSDSD